MFAGYQGNPVSNALLLEEDLKLKITTEGKKSTKVEMDLGTVQYFFASHRFTSKSTGQCLPSLLFSQLTNLQCLKVS